MSLEVNTEIVATTDNPGDISSLENANEKSERTSTEETEPKSTIKDESETEQANLAAETAPNEEDTDETPAELPQETKESAEIEEKVERGSDVVEGVTEDKTQNAAEEGEVMEGMTEDNSQNAAEEGEIMEAVTEDKSLKISLAGETEKSESINPSVGESVDIKDFANLIKSDSAELLTEDDGQKEKDADEAVDEPGSVSADISLVPDARHGPSFLGEIDLSSEHPVISPPTSTAGSSDSEIYSTPEKSVKLSYREYETVDRNLYYELHALYTNKYRTAYTKNHYYQTRLAAYYLKRRMFYALMTDKQTYDENLKKYHQLLGELDAKSEQSLSQQSTLEREIAGLINHHQFRKEEVKLCLENLQKKEFEFSKELINAKDEEGKLKAEKIVERYVKRQKTVIDALSNMRLTYIKLVNNYNEKQDMLDSLDNLGPNLHLADYEQLKSDNRNLQDKLEEKELELDELRAQCRHVMQVLAHNREKLKAIDNGIGDYRDRLDEITADYLDAREQVTGIRAERNRLRNLIIQMKEDYGLLLKPKLLMDMEESLQQAEALRVQVEEYKEDFDEISKRLNEIKLQALNKAEKSSSQTSEL
ncbi:hypothetical protein Zmor_007411 [Zophobas morio]|uniref:CCDC113/CCDC96 coiled-coil domain-containing protein n=1 Tax=Zophobas morio TaxID=2755281 RepID=A0AA38IZL8_9CUCU|nr:hypothetical protein Zmor_007411 [Zophobas morio]